MCSGHLRIGLHVDLCLGMPGCVCECVGVQEGVTVNPCRGAGPSSVSSGLVLFIDAHSAAGQLTWHTSKHTQTQKHTPCFLVDLCQAWLCVSTADKQVHFVWLG